MSELRIGYVRVGYIEPQGIQAEALGPPPAVATGTGDCHAYQEGQEQTLCGKAVLVATQRTWPHHHGGEGLCRACQLVAGQQSDNLTDPT